MANVSTAPHCPTCSCAKGHDCESCGKSVEQCNGTIRVTGVGCCGTCYRTDTHGLLVKN